MRKNFNDLEMAYGTRELGIIFGLTIIFTHWGHDNMADIISKQHFETHFPDWKKLNFKYNLTEVCSQGSNWQ